MGFDLEGKIHVLRRIMESGNKVCGTGARLWITEVNWPLEATGRYSPTLDHCRVGEREQLERIWADYYVSPLPVGEEHIGSDPVRQDGSTESLYDRIGDAYTVDHQAPVYLIDGGGTLRVLFSLPFRPRDVAEDVRSLLR